MITDMEKWTRIRRDTLSLKLWGTGRGDARGMRMLGSLFWPALGASPATASIA